MDYGWLRLGRSVRLASVVPIRLRKGRIGTYVRNTPFFVIVDYGLPSVVLFFAFDFLVQQFALGKGELGHTFVIHPLRW